MLNNVKEVFQGDTPKIDLCVFRADGKTPVTPVSATYIIRDIETDAVISSGDATVTGNIVWYELTNADTANSGTYKVIFKIEITNGYYESGEKLVRVLSR